MNEATREAPKKAAVPIWACVLIVPVITFLAFWLFGGQHYIQHYATVSYSFFHHAEDESDPLTWFAFLLETGQLAGIIAFVSSIVALVIVNRRAKT